MDSTVLNCWQFQYNQLQYNQYRNRVGRVGHVGACWGRGQSTASHPPTARVRQGANNSIRWAVSPAMHPHGAESSSTPALLPGAPNEPLRVLQEVPEVDSMCTAWQVGGER